MTREERDARAREVAVMREQKRMTCKAIAESIGCSESNISWICLKYGIEGGPRKIKLAQKQPPTCIRNGRIVRRFTREEDAAITALELEGKTPTQIARALDRKPNSILGRQMTLARLAEHGLA